MDLPSILKFDITENQKTRSNGLPITNHSMSPEGPCSVIGEEARGRARKAGQGVDGVA
jgi:hypothetical protein